MRPIALKPKDTVAVVAPAGPFEAEAFEAGVRVLQARYQVVFDEGLFSRHHYLAGRDERRLAELQSALEDDTIKAVFSARGGYGSMRLLPTLSWNKPKWLVGFSDITALHAAANAHDWVTLHGPVLTQLGKQPDDVVQRFFSILETPAPSASLTGQCVVKGHARGRLVGGNLSVFTRLLGTHYIPRLDGAVLLLEDVTERPYRLDRMWTHLRLSGVFEKVSGIVLGDFTLCDEPNGGLTAKEVLQSLAEETGLPCASGFSIGHGDINQPVPLGVEVALDADAGHLQFLEAACVEGHSA